MTTAEIRTRVLAACSDAYSIRAHKDARTGMFVATQAVGKEPLQDDPRAWLAAVLAAVARVREGFVDPRDDDGYALGGVASIRRVVEAELERLG